LHEKPNYHPTKHFLLSGQLEDILNMHHQHHFKISKIMLNMDILFMHTLLCAGMKIIKYIVKL
jgi:hypothetical protein